MDGTPLIAWTKNLTVPDAFPFTSVRYKAVNKPIGILTIVARATT